MVSFNAEPKMVEFTKHTETHDSSADESEHEIHDYESARQHALFQLLRDNGHKVCGNTIMPPEWQHPVVLPLLHEAVRMKANMIIKARKQKARRRQNRKVK